MDTKVLATGGGRTEKTKKTAGSPINGARPPRAESLLPAQPQRVLRSEYLNAGSLSPARRSALVDRLYKVYCDTVHGYTRDQFAAQIYGTDEIRLALFYGAAGELAGFSSARIELVKHAGRRYAVFYGIVFFRLGYNGGQPAMLFGLHEALRFKLRHPRTPLAYLTRGASPAAYRLLASTMPQVYPSRVHETPAEVEALVRLMGGHRDYVPVGQNPWVVRSVATPHHAERLCRIQDDPDVRFYVELNPRFADGEALLVWTPLDLPNILGGLGYVLRRLAGQ